MEKLRAVILENNCQFLSRYTAFGILDILTNSFPAVYVSVSDIYLANL